MKAVVLTIDFKIIGRTREETLDLMDQVKLNTLNELGGAPWVATNDDVVKEHMPQALICDGQGFIYQGHLTLQFGGPMVFSEGQPMHDGHKMQIRSEGDNDAISY